MSNVSNASHPPLPQTHTALTFHSTTTPLTLTTRPVPQPIPGSLIAEVLAVPLTSYAREVYAPLSPSTARNYPMPTPLTPGGSAIARIAAIGPDTTAFSAGQLVYVDCTMRARDDPAGAVYLLGIHSGHSAGSRKLMEEAVDGGGWRHGSCARFVRVPLEAVVALDEGRLCGELRLEFGQLAALTSLLVPYGGLRAVGVLAGETVLVSPATGKFGGAAVKVALAMGAKVVAWGRNQEMLRQVKEGLGRDGARVRTVKLTGDVEKDVEALKEVGKVDVFFDISPPAALSSGHVKAGILNVRPRGRVCLMGGLYGDVAIPHSKVMHEDITIRGKWMYERDDMRDLVKMVEAGVLDMGDFKVVGEFALNDWDEAFTCAEQNTGLNTVTVFTPGEE